MRILAISYCRECPEMMCGLRDNDGGIHADCPLPTLSAQHQSTVNSIMRYKDKRSNMQSCERQTSNELS